MTNEEEIIKKQTPLIYLAIKKEHLYWKTEDEFQDFVDAGYDGLLKGIRNYDDTKGVKASTFYYTCIRHEMHKVIYKKNLKKNSMKTISLNTMITGQDEIGDLIPSDYDLESTIVQRIESERLIDLVDHLPIPRDRYVIKYLFGLDGYKEMSATKLAERWGVNKNAIIHRKNRALRQLWIRIKKDGLWN